MSQKTTLPPVAVETFNGLTGATSELVFDDPAIYVDGEKAMEPSVLLPPLGSVILHNTISNPYQILVVDALAEEYGIPVNAKNVVRSLVVAQYKVLLAVGTHALKGDVYEPEAGSGFYRPTLVRFETAQPEVSAPVLESMSGSHSLPEDRRIYEERRNLKARQSRLRRSEQQYADREALFTEELNRLPEDWVFGAATEAVKQALPPEKRVKIVMESMLRLAQGKRFSVGSVSDGPTPSKELRLLIQHGYVELDATGIWATRTDLSWQPKK